MKRAAWQAFERDCALFWHGAEAMLEALIEQGWIAEKDADDVREATRWLAQVEVER